VSKINTGGKFSDDVFQFSVGLNGVGTKAVNALSSQFEVTSFREGRSVYARFELGQLKEQKAGRAKNRDGTLVRFTPDPSIFKDYQWNDEYVERRLRYYAYLNSGLSIVYNGKAFVSREGLQDLLKEEIGNEPTLYRTIYYKDKRFEFALTHTTNYGEAYYSFVNGQYTIDGGTHQSAFREGILRGVNEYAGNAFSGEDVREGLVGAIAVKLKDPVFESQTKNKLGSTEVRPWIVNEVRTQLMMWLHKYPVEAKALVEKIRTNERVRKELATLKKEARERARKVAIRIPKLTDCKIHYDTKDKRRDQSSIFLAEGDSAGGILIQARDVNTQAVFSLKGKPLNCYGLGQDAVYKNEELYNIMRALGIENDIDGLRYNKVVIATDADVDGMHIRNLLLTFFLRYFEELVVKGHVYILETPLFRVRDRKRTVYCYSESERDKAIRELSSPEVTRFKGLGEIGPQEFKQFISDNARLVSVDVQSMSAVNKTLEFVMGKNTPARRKFIESNLKVDVI
jgi:DNA gyrase/topoisomerase IV subunit B